MKYLGPKDTNTNRVATYGELGTGTSSGSNRQIYSAAYAASNTFTLPQTPARIYMVFVYNSSTPMNVPVAGYTWTAGTTSVTITDTLQAGDTVYFDVDLDPSSGATVYTDEMAQDAVGSILSTEFTYDDAGNTIAINAIAISKITGLQSALDGKQATLVSGTNIKTVNGGSILGSGDITAGDMVLASVQSVTGAKTFNDGALKVLNPAGTFAYTLRSAAITANRDLSWPVLTQNEVVAVQPAVASATNQNPVATTSTTGVMAGLAVAFTPRVTGRALVLISGQAANNTGDDGFKYDIRYGTGAAPANAAALAGTVAGAAVSGSCVASSSTTAIPIMPFMHQAFVSGLTVGTAYWFDIGQYAVTAGTATFSAINITIIEL